MADTKIDYKLDEFYKYRGYVERVVDGDTVDAILDLGFGMTTKQRLRIDGFDAPETWRPKSESEKRHGEEAKGRAVELLMDKELVFVTSKDKGIYGRYGASITLPNGTNFTQIMIQEGFQKKENYE